jgi:hypothetical protein
MGRSASPLVSSPTGGSAIEYRVLKASGVLSPSTGKESIVKPAKKGTQKSPESTTAGGRKAKGFTAEEPVAMKERLQEKAGSY